MSHPSPRCSRNDLRALRGNPLPLRPFARGRRASVAGHWPSPTSQSVPTVPPWPRRLGDLLAETLPCPTSDPFRGIRYDMAQVGALSDVVAPPYDVIGPELQDRLYDGQPVQRHPPGAEPRGARRRPPSSNRYTRAARFLKDWQRARASCARTRTPRCTSTTRPSRSRGGSYTRKGFLARVRLEPFGQGRIYPHEQTLSGPKADRLALFQATGFNLSPIFGLYPDPDGRGAPRRRGGPEGPHARWRRPTTSAWSTGSGRCSTRRRTPPCRA